LGHSGGVVIKRASGHQSLSCRRFHHHRIVMIDDGRGVSVPKGVRLVLEPAVK